MDYSYIATEEGICQTIADLMKIKVKPKEFSSFKKFKQHRDARIKELMFKLRAFFFPAGNIIKRSNGRTYKVNDDGSITLFDPLPKNACKTCGVRPQLVV